MPQPVGRTTVDLSDYPHLVVILLGTRIDALRGAATLLRTFRELRAVLASRPDGLLHHDFLAFAAWPIHVTTRLYWRDLPSVERFARTAPPHLAWWGKFNRDPAGTTVWREMYLRRGGIEGVYSRGDLGAGLPAFAPLRPAAGAMFSARGRLGLPDAPGRPPDEAAGG